MSETWATPWRNVLKAGFPMTVFDKNPKAMENLFRPGPSAAASAREVVDSFEVVLTCLPASPDVEAPLPRARRAGGAGQARHRS